MSCKFCDQKFTFTNGAYTCSLSSDSYCKSCVDLTHMQRISSKCAFCGESNCIIEADKNINIFSKRLCFIHNADLDYYCSVHHIALCNGCQEFHKGCKIIKIGQKETESMKAKKKSKGDIEIFLYSYNDTFNAYIKGFKDKVKEMKMFINKFIEESKKFRINLTCMHEDAFKTNDPVELFHLYSGAYSQLDNFKVFCERKNEEFMDIICGFRQEFKLNKVDLPSDNRLFSRYAEISVSNNIKEKMKFRFMVISRFEISINSVLVGRPLVPNTSGTFKIDIYLENEYQQKHLTNEEYRISHSNNSTFQEINVKCIKTLKPNEFYILEYEYVGCETYYISFDEAQLMAIQISPIEHGKKSRLFGLSVR